MTASRTGKLDAVKLLIDRGPAVNAKESGPRTDGLDVGGAGEPRMICKSLAAAQMSTRKRTSLCLDGITGVAEANLTASAARPRPFNRRARRADAFGRDECAPVPAREGNMAKLE